MSAFRAEAKEKKRAAGVQHDLARIFAEASQVMLAGAPSNARLAGLFQSAVPRKKKTNVWARLRGQQEQLTIQVSAECERERCLTEPATIESAV